MEQNSASREQQTAAELDFAAYEVLGRINNQMSVHERTAGRRAVIQDLRLAMERDIAHAASRSEISVDTAARALHGPGPEQGAVLGRSNHLVKALECLEIALDTQRALRSGQSTALSAALDHLSRAQAELLVDG